MLLVLNFPDIHYVYVTLPNDWNGGYSFDVPDVSLVLSCAHGGDVGLVLVKQHLKLKTLNHVQFMHQLVQNSERYVFILPRDYFDHKARPSDLTELSYVE